AKVRVDAAGGRLFVADSGHHRVVIVRLDADGRGGEVEWVVGGGGAGFEDGTFDAARFRDPHGLAVADATLYVSDTRNLAYRAADLLGGRVVPRAGTAPQAPPRARGGRGREAALNSPWDGLAHDGAVTIAMAGPHQLWRLDLATREVAPW